MKKKIENNVLKKISQTRFYHYSGVFLAIFGFMLVLANVLIYLTGTNRNSIILSVIGTAILIFGVIISEIYKK
ncbi:MAG: hypothetical protein WC867_01800 [Candidatus Pacearchaeota archaeon]|jgi:uncharacterized membrane protein